MSPPAVLRLSGITKRFGALLANDAISLELAEGEVLALLGENGAGKSTLVSILFGHYTADAGSIEVFGKPLPPGQPREGEVLHPDAGVEKLRLITRDEERTRTMGVGTHQSEQLRPRGPGSLAGRRVRVDDELGAARERRIRDGIHVADDDVRPVARFTQGVRTAVDADEHRLEVPDVAADDA